MSTFYILITTYVNVLCRCVMSLIRGSKGLCLCPVCNVLTIDARDLSKPFVLRTTADTLKIYEDAMKLSSREREQVFKEHGLRGIKASFLAIYTNRCSMELNSKLAECILENTRM